MDDQLQELINLQKEQNQLLRKYLWRFRFSLLFLMLLTTATAIGLGLLVYRNQPKVIQPTAVTGTWSATPSQGSLRLVTPQVDFGQADSDMLKLFEAQSDSGLKADN